MIKTTLSAAFVLSAIGVCIASCGQSPQEEPVGQVQQAVNENCDDPTDYACGCGIFDTPCCDTTDYPHLAACFVSGFTYHCRDLATDNSNCGACGTTCTFNGNSPSTCSNQACVCTDAHATLSSCGTGCYECNCNAGYTECTPGGCKNLSNDPANCGVCGHTCSASFICSSGACVCPAGDTNCSGTCVNESTDNSNCGSCGHVCKENGTITATCAGGACGCPAHATYSDANGCVCDAGYDAVGGTCHQACPLVHTGVWDTPGQNGWCDWCGANCEYFTPGGSCTVDADCSHAGSCDPICGSGNTCTDACIDTNNCGFKGNTCAMGHYCNNGGCI